MVEGARQLIDPVPERTAGFFGEVPPEPLDDEDASWLQRRNELLRVLGDDLMLERRIDQVVAVVPVVKCVRIRDDGPDAHVLLLRFREGLADPLIRYVDAGYVPAQTGDGDGIPALPHADFKRCSGVRSCTAFNEKRIGFPVEVGFRGGKYPVPTLRLFLRVR